MSLEQDMLFSVIVYGRTVDLQAEQIVAALNHFKSKIFHSITVKLIKLDSPDVLKETNLKNLSELPVVFIYDSENNLCGQIKFAKVNVVIQYLRSLLNEKNLANVEKFDALKKIEYLVKSNDVILFMKGSKDKPFCKFSRKAVEILNLYNFDYKAVDVLLDEKLRANLKEYSNWPTFPQLFIYTQFIGGVDIMTSLHENGDLIKFFERH